MSWFFTSLKPGMMDAELRGPYTESSVAQSAKEQESQIYHEVQYSDPFEQAEDYHLPWQIAIVARAGVDCCLYDNGSEKLRSTP